jgi:hypothetical protein
MAKAAETEAPRTRTRLTFPKPRMVPGNIGHVLDIVGTVEGGYLYPEDPAALARNVRIHIASLAILEDLPGSSSSGG